jgi:hypothetical protein
MPLLALLPTLATLPPLHFMTRCSCNSATRPWAWATASRRKGRRSTCSGGGGR